MRNGIPAATIVRFFGCTLALLLLIAGCRAEADSRRNLASGYQALESKQYDAALASADEQLRRTPSGPGSAEALYLRGRAFEQREYASPQEAQLNWQSARNAYLEALNQKPTPKLEAHIRAGLANVAYFQDDYATALREWSAAYEKLEDPLLKASALYRMGRSQQRLGQFEQADRTFATVQQKYPDTVLAQRARESAGARGFTVQLATYANRATAETAMSLLRRDGVIPTPTIDPAGRTVVRVGPFQSYQQAMALKQKYAERYPDALILP